MMSRSLRMLAPLGALVLGFAMHAPASAGEAQDVAQACIERIGSRVERAREGISSTRSRTLMVIRELNEGDAPNAAIVHAGQEGKEAINLRAADAQRDVTQIAQRCIDRLEALEAPEALIRRVRRAAHGGRLAIRMVRNRSLMVINGAVRDALND